MYGATEVRVSALRSGRNGMLLSDGLGGVPPNTQGHPQAGPVEPNRQRLTGDVRGNSNPGLLALHGLLVKEHNRKAAQLAKQNPQWEDEQIFLEVRIPAVSL